MQGFFATTNLVTSRPSILDFFLGLKMILVFDILVFDILVFVPRAKNDIYREVNYVYIKRLTSKYCPVALLERYISMGNVELSSSVALFPSSKIV